MEGMRILTLPLVALALAGCATPVQAEPAPAYTCEAVTERLAGRLFSPKSGLAAFNAAAVRSPDHEKVWYIAVTATDSDNDVTGLFAANSLSEPDLIVSVDHVADEFSDWPAGEPHGLLLTAPAARAAEDCATSPRRR